MINTFATLADWSKWTIEEVLENSQTNIISGLKQKEAAKRIKEFGYNTFPTHKTRNIILDFLSHFKSPLIIILMIATIISFFLGEGTDGIIISVIILASAITDFLQERNANNAAEKLKRQVRNKVIVRREDQEIEIRTEELCIGDFIRLNAGKLVPADARIVQAKDFFVNQSSFTGESFPCEKYSTPIAPASSDLTTLGNIVFMGSSVVSGTGSAIVVKTGAGTEFGKISDKLAGRETETEFTHGIKEFGYLIMRVTLVLVLFIFLINSLLKHNIFESFMFSIAVAVGLTPELLPMIMTVAMARGSLHMSKKGVIVKKLAVIPNFGSMEVLCTDKTGTITQDKIKLIRCVDAAGQDSESLFLLVYLNSSYQSGIKNPLDDSVLAYRQADITAFQKIDEIPFDFNRKRMSVLAEIDGQIQLICKGAPEEIFKVCNQDQTFLDEAKKQYEILSQDGYRVLAIATKQITPQQKYSKEMENNLQLQGFAAFLDPPKENVDKVIKELSKIGVEVKIITGDNYLVTQKVCTEIGLPIKGLMQGYEMEQLTDDALQKRAVNTTIFARFSPEQKNRVILALKAHHRAVGYMGDGINDAPSLKTADIGISVNTAAEVAKDAASIILTQKDLSVLKEGILEGRKTLGNTLKYIMMDLSSNFGNMFSVAAATLFLPFLPMLPVQILINNFLYDTSQLAIPADNVDASYTKSPHRWDLRMIRNYMYIFGITSSVFDLVIFYFLYNYFSVNEAQFRTGWFMESLATQILVVFIIRTQQTPFYKSKPSTLLILSTFSCLFIGWLLPYTGLGSTIGFEPLPLPIISFILCVIFAYLVSAELVKRFIYTRLIKMPK